ncbi:MAG: replication endonuclease [Campylobacterales bacterium]|nr:replication endonuclease [Campylobacterales bacterium]
MDDTKLSLKMSVNNVADISVKPIMGLCPFEGSSEEFGSLPLTTYKKVVDNCKTYGLYSSDLEIVRAKLQKQNDFLQFSYISNDQTGQVFSLKDCIVSSNHNPQRYYGEIQNRINTLEREALNAGLTPVFLTMTLPSEYHEMKQISGKLEYNPKFNKSSPKDNVKILTKLWAKLRQDRSLKELTKDQRMYYRVNEPHKDGTPHTHILLFIPKDQIDRVETAFKRLFIPVGNKFEKNIKSASSYIMKYISKTLPMSKDKISKQDQYINAWYVKHRVNRFCSSRSMAPMYLYRLLSHRFSLYGLTQVRKGNTLQVLARLEDDKIMEIWDDGELLFMRSENITLYTQSQILANLQKHGNYRGLAA